VPGHTEAASLQEATDGSGGLFGVMVPDACGNVSRLAAGGSEDSAHATHSSDPWDAGEPDPHVTDLTVADESCLVLVPVTLSISLLVLAAAAAEALGRRACPSGSPAPTALASSPSHAPPTRAHARGIIVERICRGWTDTPMIELQIEPRALQFAGDREARVRELLRCASSSRSCLCCCRRMPAHAGEVALLLRSDTAIGITGVAPPVDAGWTAR
jgi:hypothetical protein